MIRKANYLVSLKYVPQTFRKNFCQTQIFQSISQSLFILWNCVWLFNPHFDSALHSYSCLCLHQFDLCLDKSVVITVELFSQGVFQLWQWNMFNRANLVPEVVLYFFSFLKRFLLWMSGHYNRWKRFRNRMISTLRAPKNSKFNFLLRKTATHSLPYDA